MPGKKFTVSIRFPDDKTDFECRFSSKSRGMEESYFKLWEKHPIAREKVQEKLSGAGIELWNTFQAARRAIAGKPWVHSVGLAHESGLFSIQIERV